MFVFSFLMNSFVWHAHSSTRTPTEGLQFQIFSWLYFGIGLVFGIEEYTKDYRWLGVRSFLTGLLGTWYLAMARAASNGWPIDIVYVGKHVIENTDDIAVLPHGTAMMLTSVLFIQCVLFVVLCGLTAFIALNNLIPHLPAHLGCERPSYQNIGNHLGNDMDDDGHTNESDKILQGGYQHAL